jgi:hypothetical protein
VFLLVDFMPKIPIDFIPKSQLILLLIILSPRTVNTTGYSAQELRLSVLLCDCAHKLRNRFTLISRTLIC